MPSLNAFLSGLSALVLVLTGYIAAVKSFVRAKERKSKTVLFAGLMLLMMGSMYLGLTLSWISLLITNQNLPEALVGQLCYGWTPLGIVFAIYVGLSILKPSFARPTAIAYFLPGIIFWVALIGFPQYNLTSSTPFEVGGGMIDIEAMGFARIYMSICLFSFAILIIPSFAWFAGKSKGLMRKKSIYNAVGTSLFVIGGAFDTTFLFSEVILLVRALMVTGYILIYLAYTSQSE